MTIYENVFSENDQHDTIRVLAVVQPRQGAELARILSHTRWEVYIVNSIADAVRAMESSPVSVILCEHRLPDGTWLNLLERAVEFSLAPQVIVLLETPDARLWAEVLNCGGCDILAQPLEPREVYQVIATAWRRWKASLANPRRDAASAIRLGEPALR